MSLLKDIKEIFSEEFGSANTFFSIGKELTMFFKHNQDSGLNAFPDYCDFILSKSKDGSSSVLIRTYYKTKIKDKVYEKKREVKYRNLKDIPQNIQEILTSNSTIKIKVEELDTLSTLNEQKIGKPLKFDQLVVKIENLLKSLELPMENVFSKELSIHDKLFCKKVNISFSFNLESKIPSKEFIAYYADITEVPSDISEKLSNDGQIKIILK
jgi:hypothetical protein